MKQHQTYTNFYRHEKVREFQIKSKKIKKSEIDSWFCRDAHLSMRSKRPKNTLLIRVYSKVTISNRRFPNSFFQEISIKRGQIPNLVRKKKQKYVVGIVGTGPPVNERQTAQ